MLIMGCLMQCLDPVLTVAACFSSRDIFYSPLAMRAEQREARQSLSESSDLMASIRAYNTFHDLSEQQGWGAAKDWAFENFVSISAMTSIQSIRSQLLSELIRIGFVSREDLVGSRRSNMVLRSDAEVNKNADLEYLQVALWATGLPDSLAARRQLGNFGTLRTRMENHAGLHPSSVTFHRRPPQDRDAKLPPWFLYREMILSSQVFLRGVTAIAPEQIALFGGYNLKHNLKSVEPGENGYAVLDDWIVLDGSCQDTINILVDARSEIQAALDLKVMDPRKPLPEGTRAILDAVCDVYKGLDDEYYDNY